MPRPTPRGARPANRPGQTRGGRRGKLEAFERQAQQSNVATATRAEQRGVVELPAVISAGDLAAELGVAPAQVIKALFSNGIMATINQSLDYDTAAVISSDLGFQVREQAGTAAAGSAAATEPRGDGLAAAAALAAEDEALLRPRPPVVTIMGHVDHGKTSLLDAIRETKVAAGEAGGITQHIGAYQVTVNERAITFLDTPGHEAFTAMRARGAQVTDIAVIVVAADDGVMPQTREAIDHARAAGVPILIAINKIDTANANSSRVKQELADLGVVVTDFGGQTEAIEVSAKTRQGLDTLLETILLVTDAEVNPQANPDRPGQGIVVEASMDKARGAVATVLVQRGTLRVGDVVVAGTAWGRVRALFDDLGNRVREALPSFPVEILGLNGVPAAGDRLIVVADEKAARAAVDEAQRAAAGEGETDLSMEAVFARIRSGSIKESNLIVKADVQGSVEPIVNSLEKLGTPGETRAKVIHAGLGNINITDVNLAVASKAMIIAFNVRPEAEARRAAEQNGVEIREYTIIYQLLEDVEKLLAGTLEPKFEEVVHGHLEVRATFKAGKRIIAGCVVSDGVVHRRDRVRAYRGGKQIWDGAIESLRRVKEDVNEVREGFECGVVFEDFNDIQEGDTYEAYSTEQV